MDKNRFLLILLFSVVVIVFLYKQYISIKQNTINDYQNLQTLTQKIKKIDYLQKLYKNKKPYLINKCKIITTDKYKINCTNLTPKEFKVVSNKIFNQTFNIIKFSITQNSIYVEISK